MLRFIVGAYQAGKFTNLFADNRSYKNKKSAVRAGARLYDGELEMEVMAVKVLSDVDKIRVFLEEELIFHTKMKEQDDKDGEDTKFRLGIISQTKAMLNFLNTLE